MSFGPIPDLPENIFQIVFEKSPGSLLVKADFPLFTIIAASDAYLATTSSSREEIIGKGFFEVFPEEKVNIDPAINARSVFKKVVETRKIIHVPHYRFDVYKPENNSYQKRYWSCSNIPIFNADNEVAFILNTVSDITAEVNATEAALESENRLRLATEAAEMATWDYGIDDNSFVCSARLMEIFGHPVYHVIAREDLQKQIDEEDMKNVVAPAYGLALKTGNYVYEVRIYWPDKTLHWIKTQGSVMYDEKERPVRMLGTVLDITETKRDEIRKNDFIAMASHELRTPLTSLKAYLQILTRKLAGNKDSFVNDTLLKAGNQVNKMTSLIHSFLDLSKIEPGKLNLNMKEFDINKAIENTITDVRHNNRNHLINFGQLDSILVNADSEKIGQVVTNLLNNAIKYSDKGSTVIVKSKKTGDGVLVSVEDEGIGIKPKDQEKLFQRFYRADNEKMKNISGFGIGLYLASEIIHQHKGKIWVESEVGKGSTFYFSLPLEDGQN